MDVVSTGALSSHRKAGPLKLKKIKLKEEWKTEEKNGSFTVENVGAPILGYVLFC